MPGKYHQRFQIDVGLEEARRRFLNRAQNEILSYGALGSPDSIQYCWNRTCRAVANRLGEVYQASYEAIAKFTNNWEWHRTLQAVEAVYDEYNKKGVIVPFNIDEIIRSILSQAEVDLEVRWMDGHFLPAGAPELDEALVNDSLRWLRSDPSLKTVWILFPRLSSTCSDR